MVAATVCHFLLAPFIFLNWQESSHFSLQWQDSLALLEQATVTLLTASPQCSSSLPLLCLACFDLRNSHAASLLSD